MTISFGTFVCFQLFNLSFTLTFTIAFDIDDKHLNICMEYAPGGSVASLLRNYGAFEESLIVNWVKQILLGLTYLHERDIIHRNLKGTNILVDSMGRIKISGFGSLQNAEKGMHYRS